MAAEIELDTMTDVTDDVTDDVRSPYDQVDDGTPENHVTNTTTGKNMNG